MTNRYFWDSEGLQILAPTTEEEIEGIHLNGGCTELTQELMIALMQYEALLCKDEGCPRAGAVHVCIPKGEPVVDRDEAGNPIPFEVTGDVTAYIGGPRDGEIRYEQRLGRGRRACPECGRVPYGDEPCSTVGCLAGFAQRTTPIIARVIAEEIQKKSMTLAEVQKKQHGYSNTPEGVKLIDGSYERGDGSIAFAAPDRNGSIMRCLVCRTTFYEKDGCNCEPAGERSGFDGSKL